MVSCVPIFKAHTPHRMTPGDGFMLHFALLKLIGNCLACSASNPESCFVATFFWLPSEKCMGWIGMVEKGVFEFAGQLLPSYSSPHNLQRLNTTQILVEFCINLLSWPDTSPLFMNHKTFPSF